MNHHNKTLPGAQLDLSEMPGHWLLARMVKRVLRPGGLEMTRRMLDALHITSADRVVELGIRYWGYDRERGTVRLLRT